MKQDEIIEMAKQAGLAHFYDSEGCCTGITDADLITADKEKNDARLVEMLMPFAKLVAEKERKECAEQYIRIMRNAVKDAVEIERKACLKIAESMSLSDANMSKTWRTGCRDVAEAIRARGEA